MNPIPLLIIGTLAAGYFGYYLGQRRAFVLVSKVHMLVYRGEAEIQEDGTVELVEPDPYLEDQRLAGGTGLAMSNWIATNRKPGELPEKPVVGDLRSTKLKAQFEAATKAAKALAKEIDGDVNVNLSGYASTKDDPEPDIIQITVAKA